MPLNRYRIGNDEGPVAELEPSPAGPWCYRADVEKRLNPMTLFNTTEYSTDVVLDTKGRRSLKPTKNGPIFRAADVLGKLPQEHRKPEAPIGED